MAKIRVLIVGGTGHTGSSVVDGLLETGNFAVVALIRPASIEKPAVRALQEQGVEIREGDLEESEEDLVKALAEIDIVISCVSASQQQCQIPLANAAKKAGVKRFVPCGFITVAPPAGVMLLRDQKEVVYNHIKRLWLPYTFIDVGWWYQLAFPRLPSGRIDYAVLNATNEVIGGGNVLSAITDLRNIGRYVAKIIADERTLNRMVFAYDTLMTQNQIYDLLEELSKEKIDRNYVPDEALYARGAVVRQSIQENPNDRRQLNLLYLVEYQLSWGVRGDNNPEYAKYLGYLLSKELYPDFEPTSFRDYLESVINGTAKHPYAS